ncbi:hypothetical protein MRS60_07825 [Burkholderia pyrrocinia]|uniref:hypothetical protein n=1 Tax=Burkholderia pyrrocinia TaxID=60550 RepID=UPI001FB5054E|nr:hypothetical protein [Burkholderia pyrrocinia]UOB56997.1 hypothetical protein MRS60_07825 [Burkholderia pyrrocinia]
MSDDHAPPLPTHLRHILRKLGAALVPEFQRWFLEEFKMLSNHASMMDEHIRDQQRRYDESFQDAIKDLDEEDKALYADYKLEESEFIARLPRLQWHSQFLFVYATFEHAMNHICDIAQKRLSLPISVRDFDKHGAGVERAVKYLRKVADIAIETGGSDWQRIKLLNMLRNKITHADGTFEKGSSEIAQLAKVAGITLTHDDDSVQCELSADFVRDAVARMHKFLLNIARFQHPKLM